MILTIAMVTSIIYISPSDRRHVIDCLPNVWMVDGILVTAAERDQVSRFFKNSEVLERPVRHKLRPIARTKFVPSHIKDLNQRAVLGERDVLFFT